MTVELRSDSSGDSSVRYFTRSSIPGNRVGRRWDFDDNIYYDEPEWLPGDDEQLNEDDITDTYEYQSDKIHKHVEKKLPVKHYLGPVINIIRCAYLTHVPGIQESDLEYLNKWYQKHWRIINSSDFNYTNLSDSIKNDILYNYKDPVKIQMYLGAHKILYTTGTIGDEYKNDKVSMSKSPNFRHFFSLTLKNPVSLNSLIIMTNCIIMMEETLHDHDAQLIIIDVLLSCYPCALENFVKLDGVSHIKTYLDYLASNSVLDAHTNYLLKCFSLLGQLDITLDVLKQSKIGIPINIIASGKVNPKGTVHYECSDIGVKVKATDLIKRWKSIRDEAIQRPQKLKSDDKLNSTESDVKTVNTSNGTRNGYNSVNGEGKGSFVLNILDTIVEEHEKGKKRKQELRNAHKYGSRKLDKKSDSDSSIKSSKLETSSNIKVDSSDVIHNTHSADYRYQFNNPMVHPAGIPMMPNPPIHVPIIDHSYNKYQHQMMPNNMQNSDIQHMSNMNYNGMMNSSMNYSQLNPGTETTSETAKVQSLLNFFRTNEANKMSCQTSL